MNRRILNFHRNSWGWWADLNCGHVRKVRASPDLGNAQWIDSAEGRKSYIGKLIECAECA
ncbi:MAG TPA: DUF3565 domain-containing protein [Candidatus Thermoplasmatota archaeon]|nr:DUF3565 domain-containing protein [Candidatus Thermoplasmatota archaeon]